MAKVEMEVRRGGLFGRRKDAFTGGDDRANDQLIETVERLQKQVAKSNKGGGFGGGIKPFLFGSLIGGGLALLYAPKPGTETRQQLFQTGTELKESATQLAGQAKEQAGTLQDQAQQTLTQAKDQAQQVTGQVREQAQGVAAQAQDQASQVADQMKDQTEQVRGQAQQATGQARDQAQSTAVRTQDAASHATQPQSQSRPTSQPGGQRPGTTLPNPQSGQRRPS